MVAPLIQALGSQGQKRSDFEASLVYRERVPEQPGPNREALSQKTKN